MLDRLIKIANFLDTVNRRDDAEVIDYMIKKYADEDKLPQSLLELDNNAFYKDIPREEADELREVLQDLARSLKMDLE